MRQRSLQLRLAIGALLAIFVAFGFAAIGLEFVIGRTVQRVALLDVDSQLQVLTGNVEIRDDDTLSLQAELQDPRFAEPYGGFYWQIGRNGNVELRSQSLWDQALPWTKAANQNDLLHLPGPNNIPLLATQQSIVLGTDKGDQTVDILVAIDVSRINDVRREFAYVMAPSLALLGLALIAAVWAFLRHGLSPLDALRRALSAVHNRDARLIEGSFPSEVQPLVDDLNALIVRRETQLTSARARAGDLAHGLKTPLAVLDAVARELERDGQPVHAASVRAEVMRMDAHIRRTLAQARAGLAAIQTKNSMELGSVCRQVVNVMQNIASSRGISFVLDAPEPIMATMDEADFLEICGNILDNGGKWAASRVEVSLRTSGEMVVLTVDDDGPGLPLNSELLAVGRGIRLDQSVAGTGFGLAIVKDLVEAYDGEIAFGRSSLGGFRVEVNIPNQTLRNKGL